MMVTTTATVPGYRVTGYKGMAWGLTVRAKNIGQDLLAGCKNITGGEVGGYVELLQQARQSAIDRLSDKAAKLGADAVVEVRFGASAIAQGMAEIVAYGTAVTVEPA
ncbi:MAG: hypothetical protein CSA66_03885 [Proteobacteria bacterium]|nr:MAG: hypothetical protein CSA66_03885 [Pseudomonadota bacterium]